MTKKKKPEDLLTKEQKKSGRPTKYKPEYCQDMIDYFSIDPFYIVEREVNASGKDGIYVKEVKYDKIANQLPTFARYAQKHDLDVTTLLLWCDKHPEFSKAYKRCKSLQRDIMIANGMAGLYQSNFTVFAMKNMHNWTDKTEVSHEGKFSLEGALTKTIEDNTKAIEHNPNSDAVEVEYTEVDEDE